MTDDDLAARVETAARTVPGVITVYSALPPLARSARQLTSGDNSVPLVAVSRQDGTLTVTVNVGVTGSGQAPITAAAVASAVRSLLTEPDTESAQVLVRVSRIHD